MCNEGRYGYPHVHSDRAADRAAERRDGERRTPTSTGRTLPRELDRTAARRPAGWPPCSRRILTVEEAYLLAKYVRGDRSAGRCWRSGRCRSSARTRRFPNGFTIRAEKCPNRRGVEEVIAPLHAAACRRSTSCWPSSTAGESRGALGHRRLQAAIGSTSRPPSGSQRLELLVVQDLFPSPLLRAGRRIVARRGLRRARRLVRQPRRPAAIGRLGHPPAGRRADRGELVLGAARPHGLYNAAARAGRGRPRDPRTFAAAGGPMPADWASI